MIDDRRDGISCKRCSNADAAAGRMSVGADPARFQLMDGPDEVQGIYTAEQLAELVGAGTVGDWARVLDLETMQTVDVAAVVAANQEPAPPADAPTDAAAAPAPDAPPPPVLPPGCRPLGAEASQAAPANPPSSPASPPPRRPPSGSQTSAPTITAVPSETPANTSSAATSGERQEELTSGSEWDGHRIVRLLGRGGMGTVYLATRISDGTQVALKLLARELAADPDFIRRFEREAKASQAIDAPEVVTVLGTGTWQGTPYFVMQYVEGTDLATKLSGGFRFTLEDTRRFGAQAARALWAAAKKGIVHRDVKPANMILTRSGKLMLMDFGLARLVRDASAGTRLTQAGTVLGTARYMSPEQARGETCDHRSDIYSLGCVLYEMLAGSPPFTARDIVGLLHKHVHEQPKPLRSHCPDLPRHVEVAIMRCLAKQPAERYPSSMELVHDLETDPAAAASTRRPTGFDPDASSGSSRPATPSGPSSGVPLLPVLLVLALLGGGGWYAWDRYIAPAGQRDDPGAEASVNAKPPPPPTETDTPTDDPAPTPGQDQSGESATRPPPAQEQPAAADRVGTLATYQQALVAEDWPTCWRAARLLLQRWPAAAREARVRIPLHVEASPAGARVWRDDREAGTAPCTILCEPGARGTLTVTHPGHGLASAELAPCLASSWRWAPQLGAVERLAWQAKLRGHPRGRIVATGSGPRAAALVTDAGLCYIVDAHSGSRRPINLALDQLDLAAGPIAFRGQLFVLLRDRLLQIDERIGRVLWRWPAASDNRRFIDALVAGPDELVFRRTKLYTATTQGELVVLTIDAGGPVPLQRTWPGQRITAPVAVQALDAAEGALVVPCDDRLQFYNSASHTQHSPLNPTFAFSTARPVREQPLVWRAGGLRAVLAADNGGNAHLIDVRPDIDPVGRERGYWRLPGPPIHPPIALGDNDHAAVLLANGRLAVLDLSNDGRVVWQRDRDNPLPAAAGQLATDGETLLLATAAGELIALAADNGAERWRVDLGAPLATGASLIADRILVASTGGVLMALTP